MVAVVQLVEHQIVALGVVGSNPIGHPIFKSVQAIFININKKLYSMIIMREWLSGRASPCQGERREFESRLPLQCAGVTQW